MGSVLVKEFWTFVWLLLYYQGGKQRRRICLSICHEMITEYGGQIYAESKLGKGATFIVELPISKVDGEGVAK